MSWASVRPYEGSQIYKVLPIISNFCFGERTLQIKYIPSRPSGDNIVTAGITESVIAFATFQIIVALTAPG